MMNRCRVEPEPTFALRPQPSIRNRLQAREHPINIWERVRVEWSGGAVVALHSDERTIDFSFYQPGDEVEQRAQVQGREKLIGDFDFVFHAERAKCTDATPRSRQ